MEQTIWKYKLKIQDTQNIKMPKGSIILSVQMQHYTPCIWALVNPNISETELRNIEIFGTGNPIHVDMGVSRNYLGTVQDGGLVWHIFEYTGV